jgi:hypothetical protein
MWADWLPCAEAESKDPLNHGKIHPAVPHMVLPCCWRLLRCDVHTFDRYLRLFPTQGWAVAATMVIRSDICCGMLTDLAVTCRADEDGKSPGVMSHNTPSITRAGANRSWWPVFVRLSMFTWSSVVRCILIPPSDSRTDIHNRSACILQYKSLIPAFILGCLQHSIPETVMMISVPLSIVWNPRPGQLLHVFSSCYCM